MDFVSTNLLGYIWGHILPWILVITGSFLLYKERTTATRVMLFCAMLWPILSIAGLIWYSIYPVNSTGQQTLSLLSTIHALTVDAIRITWGLALICYARQLLPWEQKITALEQEIAAPPSHNEHP